MSAWLKYIMFGKLLVLQQTHRDEEQQAERAQHRAEQAGLGIVARGHGVENGQRQGFGAPENVAAEHQRNAHFAHAARQREQQAAQQRGQGAYLNGAPISVSKAETLGDALVATGFPYDFSGRLDRILERLSLVLPKSQGLRRIGAAAVDMAYVACGRLDMFYEEGLKPWDFAAGLLLVEEAGGRVTNLRGEALHFGDVLMASNGLVHQESVDLLGPTAV